MGLTEPAFCHNRESLEAVPPPIPRQIARKKAEKATRGKSTDYVAEREGFELMIRRFRVVFGLGLRAVADHFSSDPEFPRKNRSVPAAKPRR